MRIRTVLWLDCIGAFVAGSLILGFHQLISRWDSLDISIVLFVGVANLVYGFGSLYVNTIGRTVRSISTLALANVFWLAVCISIIAFNWNSISSFGIAHKLLEGTYVAGLGITEWKFRNQLAEHKIH